MDSSHFNNYARVDSETTPDTKISKNQENVSTRGSSLKIRNHRAEASSERPNDDFTKSTDQTDNNADYNYNNSPHYIDHNIDKNHDKQASDENNETYDVSDKKADDRFDSDDDTTYVDDSESNDVTDDQKSDKNETTKPEYDYIYYYYYDYVYPEAEGVPEKKVKKTPKGLETLPNPSYLMGSETTETTLGDELTTVFPTSNMFEEKSS